MYRAPLDALNGCLNFFCGWTLQAHAGDVDSPRLKVIPIDHDMVADYRMTRDRSAVTQCRELLPTHSFVEVLFVVYVLGASQCDAITWLEHGDEPP